MKKLIMCVAAALSACALNAATVNWSVSDLFDADGNSLIGTITLASGTYTSTGTISDYYAGGSFDGATWGTDPFATGSAWTMTAKVQDANGDLYEQVFNVVLGNIDASDDRANGAAFEALVAEAKDTMLPMGVLDITDLASQGWTAAGGGGGGGGTGGVPEPTSGLLLALGGAMLALRRRRA